MRWILFDLVVGAALVWLLWGERFDDRPAPAASAAALSRPGVRESTPAEPALPDPPPPAVEMAPPAIAAAAPPSDRGRRLQALARDVEALFLRGRE